AGLHHDCLRDIDGAAAAQPNHAVAGCGLVQFHRFEHVSFDGVSVHLVEYLEADSRILEYSDHGIERGRGTESGVGHYERLANSRLFQAGGKAPHGAAAEDDPGRKRKCCDFIEHIRLLRRRCASPARVPTPETYTCAALRTD